MRTIHISDAKPGLKLARAVLDEDGKTLLKEDMVLTTNFIRRLKRLNCTYIDIDDQSLEDNSRFNKIISEQTRIQAVDCMKEITECIRYGRIINLDSVKTVLYSFIEEIINKKEIMLNLKNIQSYDDYTFGHCISVTAVSIMIGMSLGYNKDKLFELGLGVFLHDVGKIFIPHDIINKVGKLTDAEFDIVKRHPWHGYTILYKTPGITINSAFVSLQHHEKYDGTGYPYRLKQDQICEFARICAIADVFDALSSRRPYRDKLPAHQVFEYLLRNIGTHFDPYILDKFIRQIVIFPEGTKVELNNGLSGFVIKQNDLYPARPVVRVSWDKGRELAEPFVINLVNEPSLAIVEVVS